jgi:hypothetical protein
MKKKSSNSLNSCWHKTLTFFTIFVTISLAMPQTLLADDETTSIFGEIAPPPGVNKYQAEVEKVGGQVGIILFLSNIIRLITVAAGIWVMFNLISAGWLYINSSGDSGATEKVSAKITNSIIGLAVVALSYTLAGVVGYLIFGDAGFILNPALFTIN